MEIRFRAGEMAQMHHISKQTLIYYDNIDLFRPREVDHATGYRYYHLDQCEDLDIILFLKSLGMKLKEMFRSAREEFDVDIHDFMVEVADGPEGREIFKKVALPSAKRANDSLPAGYFAYFFHKGGYEALAASRTELMALGLVITSATT